MYCISFRFIKLVNIWEVYLSIDLQKSKKSHFYITQDIGMRNEKIVPDGDNTCFFDNLFGWMFFQKFAGIWPEFAVVIKEHNLRLMRRYDLKKTIPTILHGLLICIWSWLPITLHKASFFVYTTSIFFHSLVSVSKTPTSLKYFVWSPLKLSWNPPNSTKCRFTITIRWPVANKPMNSCHQNNSI